jgi:hypothetical protein
MKTIDTDIEQAISAYTGTITKCPPCKQRAPGELAVVKIESVEWLKQQPGGGWPKDNQEAKRRRLRAEHDRITEHNEVVRKRHGLKRGEIG